MEKLKRNLASFKYYLSFADMFGQKIDLTYSKDIYYRTYYGAIFTILIFLFLIIQAIAGYKDLTTRLNPIINTLEVEEEKIPRIDLKKENITIALGFVSENRSEYLFDPTYFEIESKYVSKSKNESYDKTLSHSLDLENCHLHDFTNFREYFDNFNLINSLCIKSGKYPGIEIFSKPEEFQENYIKLNFKFCSESKSKKCKNPEEILARFNYLNIYLYIVHDYFDAMDLKNPIKRRLSMLKWNFEDFEIRRKDSVYLTQHSLKDYNNLFMALSEPESKNFVSYSEKNILRNFKFGRVSPFNTNGNNKFMELYIKAHYIPVKITRKYNTFIDLLGNLGGLFNVFFIVGNIIFGYVDRTLLDCKMINDHFNIVDTNKYDRATRKSTNEKTSILNIFPNKEDGNSPHNDSKDAMTGNFPLNEHDKYFKENKYSIRNFSYRNSYDNNNPNPKNSFNPFRSSFESQTSSVIQDFNKLNKKEPLLCEKRDKKYKFRYNLKDIIMSLFCFQKKSLRKRNEIFDNCKRLIDNYIDIKNLISLSQEHKVMRSILFDKIQLSLINFYKKPIIKINKENQNKTILIYRKSIYDYEEKPTDENFEVDVDVNAELFDIKKKIEIIKSRKNFTKDKVDEKIIELTELK